MNHLKIAIKASLEAGVGILKIYNSDNFETTFKSDNSPLTKADVIANNIITKHLSRTDIPILSEEGKHIPYKIRKSWKELWIVDPIDGTKEFLKKNDEFTVNIAFVENQTPTIGVIFVPALKELYFSSSALGSYKVKVNLDYYDIDQLILNAIKIPIERADKTYTIVASRSHISKETENFIFSKQRKYSKINLISKGSSLKICMVAEGVADCYPRLAPTMEWDTAAGQAICEHAGFKVIDWETKNKMLYNKKELLNNWFIVE